MLALALVTTLAAGDGESEKEPWQGPGRFCGYATVLDLADREQLVLGEGGMHSSHYRWSGPFGAIDVSEINWASPPDGSGRVIVETGSRRTYRKRLVSGEWKYAVWDKGHLTAYLSSNAFDGSKRDLTLVDRIALVDHAGETAKDCKYRLVFSFG